MQNNSQTVRGLIRNFDLDLDANDPRLVTPAWWDRTLIGSRRPLADWLRLQLYGFAWAATGIDQYYPDTYTARTEDFDEDITWGDFAEPTDLSRDDLALDVLAAGLDRAGGIPVVLVNEPMFISDGQNSDLRYNLFYPRWAYDAYRGWLAEAASTHDWQLVDLWDVVNGNEFTDSPVHLTPQGVEQFVSRLLPEISALEPPTS